MRKIPNTIREGFAVSPSGTKVAVKLHGFTAPFWVGTSTMKLVAKSLHLATGETPRFVLQGKSQDVPCRVEVLNKAQRMERVSADAQRAAKCAQMRLEIGWTRGLRLPRSLFAEIDALKQPKAGAHHGIESRADVIVRLVRTASACRENVGQTLSSMAVREESGKIKLAKKAKTR